MKNSYKIVTYVIILLGGIHIGISPIIFDEFTMRVGWFIGVGLMMIFLGFLNIAYWRISVNDKLVKGICITANSIALVYSFLVVTVDKDPQSYLAVVLLAYLTFSSIYLSIRNNKGTKGTNDNSN